MRSYTLFIYIIALGLCTACIDTFQAELPQDNMHLLVIEGNICSQSDCTFHLSHTVDLEANSHTVGDCLISDAQIQVIGDDGQSWQGKYTAPGQYTASVGALNTTAHYWVEIIWEGNSYSSIPATPLQTPRIANITWEQPRPDQLVDILITPASDSPSQYFRWDYEEYWEINTPLLSIFEYNPTHDAIEYATCSLNQGWCQAIHHLPVVAGSSQYSEQQISNFRLYQCSPHDDRFNTRYCTRITQRAITREQFEYEQLSLKLSDDMGGLFTPQPSSLPSNIMCQTSERHAIGYVGVNLNTSTSTLFIEGNEVGHQSTHLVIPLSEQEARRYTWAELYSMDYRVYQYFPDFNSATWVNRWCVDCTDSTWGASLTRPSFWVGQY